MNKKLTIIFIVFLSFLVLGFCGYRSFRLPNKKEVIGVKVNNLQYKAKNIPEFARQDFLLFVQQLDADEKKAFKRKKVDRQNIERNIKILKDQGIWDGLIFGLKGISFEEYYRSFQDSQKTFQLQLDNLLKKVENKEDLESFREELEKLRQKHLEDIDVFVDFAKEIQEEAKKPVPFLATWTGIGILIFICVICSLVTFFILADELSVETIANKEHLVSLLLLFFIIYLSQFIIFPLLSLKMCYFSETYKHFFRNKFKAFSLFIIIPFTPLVLIFFVDKYNKDEDNDQDDLKNIEALNPAI